MRIIGLVAPVRKKCKALKKQLLSEEEIEMTSPSSMEDKSSF